MDYEVGSIADMISGTTTPNRPKFIKKALTPIKHQKSPNVTPKSELVIDRSIFLSPSVQKKKAVVKKSPKRIFEKDDLDKTTDLENVSKSDIPKSPRGQKAKKHLQKALTDPQEEIRTESPKKKRKKSLAEAPTEDAIENIVGSSINPDINGKEKRKKRNKSKNKNIDSQSTEISIITEGKAPTDAIAKNKKHKNNTSTEILANPKETAPDESTGKKKKRKNKKKSKKITDVNGKTSIDSGIADEQESNSDDNFETSKGAKVNTKAITEADTDSEHGSDNEIESETEQNFMDILENGPKLKDSDSEEELSEKPEKKKKKEKKQNKVRKDDKKDKNSKVQNDEKVQSGEKKAQSSDESVPKSSKKAQKLERTPESEAEELKRTLFVGNVPISKKIKKDIKKIFLPYGPIESVRIRAIPVKDMRVKPMVALVKQELHPERSCVNVYVKFMQPDSVKKALVENNRMVGEHHIRVTPSDITGVVHEPSKTLFLGNVPFGIEDDVLRKLFEKCGEIESVRIIRDKNTQIGKGFGYVNFASKDGVELALLLPEDQVTIKNRILRLNRCQKSPNNRPRNNDWHKQHTNRNNQNKDENSNQGKEGAFRRIDMKRKTQENSEGPPPQKKFKNVNQPIKDKKAREEFTGVTAEKKKKKKFDKGQKNKKKLSEILTKN